MTPLTDAASPRVQAGRLSTAQSLLLDLVRIGAAILVAVGHLTQPFFSVGWPDLTYLARAAVAVFFVLSGFVIRYVTSTRRTDLAGYLKDRGSRVYSVALPAMLVTLAADSISRRVNPVFFATWTGDWTHPFGRVVQNLVFTAQLWQNNVNPLSNSPFWSLNYEVGYYILYGCAFYLTGLKRWAWIALLVLALGPEILSLAPLWLAGCVAFDLYRRWRRSGRLSVYLNWGMAASAVAAVALFAFVREYPGAWYALWQRRLLLTWASLWITPLDYLFGLLGTVFFLKLLEIAGRVHIAPNRRGVAAVRFISEGTFPLYLLHFPLLVLIAAWIPYNHANGLEKTLVFAAIFAVGVLAGHPCNALKRWMRNVRWGRWGSG